MLRVAIAGAGVTGLVTSIAFALHGHQITIYERKTEDVFANEGGAGIQLQSNAIRILHALGIDIGNVGHDSGVVVVRRYATEEPLGLVKPVTGLQVYVLGSDFRRLMLAQALARGVRVQFGTDIAAVDAAQPAILLKTGVSVNNADLIIAADGVRSKVRRSLFPSVHPEVRTECTFQFQVPFSGLEKSEAARRVIRSRNANLIVGPNTAIVASPIFSRGIFDLQFITRNYRLEDDPHPEIWNEHIPDGMIDLQRRYQNHGPIIQESMSRAQGGVWKWRHAECFAPSWTSDNGKVILAGEPCHAMVPYAGQGAGMCIEDAAVLAEVFRNVSTGDDEQIRRRAKLYQDLRQPRTIRCHRRAQALGASFGQPDGEGQRKRDAATRTAQAKKAKLPPQGDPNAHPLSNEFDNWLEQYDAVQEARKALQAAGLVNLQTSNL
ncbi:hypothetical protein LTR47_000068 [Exophiala xenobiotica]|nr:hypothetical protein LTR41_003847 [Exophiala xenobiotica]KAK5228606.1 hypothetical protein LTR72_002490 [Exophiala xenobiotica]KAK5238325.1 hypothetical protein LTR47_000068 [Exophiala xenobiotica]KAK5252693.1 hypothetical protein LTS06_002870 [Exophiala xenobiotica]KAK5301956.1 hypothetical protein LTR14_000204 [Exophiala xenobiotica]